MALVLMILALGLAGVATFLYVYLIGLGCGMGPTGCRSDLLELYLRHLGSEEGIFYLVVMGLAALLFGMGWALRK